MTYARQTAFKVLSKIEKDGSYSNLALNDAFKDSTLCEKDRALAHRIVKTVLERKITADYNLSLYLSQPLKKLNPRVLTILRMGACQLLFMDKIPQSAVVNECVKTAKNNGLAFASGLINAVLRKVAQNGLTLPKENDKTQYLSIKYSFSEHIVKSFIDYYGLEITEKILQKSAGGGRIYIRKNSLNDKELNIPNEKCDFPPFCHYLTEPAGFADSIDFKNGNFHVQDKSSQICCYLLGVEDGQRVLDVCAAPGGKTMTLSQYAGKNGEIVSCDIYEHKLKLIDDTAKRLGLENVKVLLRDGANDKTDIGSFDRILCDVPCSGFGVTAKKPEIKYKSQAEIKDLPITAIKILENSARLLKKGGRLVYSTCTLLPEENRDVCNAFLLNHSEFKSAAIDENISGFRDGDYLTIMPYEYDCDGFFVAVFERS